MTIPISSGTGATKSSTPQSVDQEIEQMNQAFQEATQTNTDITGPRIAENGFDIAKLEAEQAAPRRSNSNI